MKTRILPFIVFAIGLCGLAMLVVPALHAQTATDPSSIISPNNAADIATPFVVALAVKFPVILTIVAAMGTLRFFFKPIVSLIEAYVKSTPSTADDEAVAKVEASAAWKWWCWVIDFVFSIKVGPQFTASSEKPPAQA